MSDPVLIALIAGVPGTLAALASFLTAVQVMRSNRHINETRGSISELEKNTNSMKDALVKVTGQLEYDKGAQGKAPGFPIPPPAPTPTLRQPGGWWYHYKERGE